jgi:hypothetical protein
MNNSQESIMITARTRSFPGLARPAAAIFGYLTNSGAQPTRPVSRSSRQEALRIQQPVESARKTLPRAGHDEAGLPSRRRSRTVAAR